MTGRIFGVIAGILLIIAGVCFRNPISQAADTRNIQLAKKVVIARLKYAIKKSARQIHISRTPSPFVNPTATNGTAPLITETMTNQEREAYLKEKGVPIITKENFKEPELIWERTFSEPINPSTYGGRLSFPDITDNGNFIIVAGKTMYFLNGKGNTRNKIPVRKDHYKIAKSGMGAVVDDWNEKKKILTLSYYDESGNKKWTKKIKLADFAKIQFSANGSTIAVVEYIPDPSLAFDTDEYTGDMRMFFFDNKGRQIYKYGKFAMIGAGALSADGRYYIALIYFWQDSPGWDCKLIYFDLANGKIFWQRPYMGGITGDSWTDDYLAISGKGSYVAVTDETPSLKTGNSQLDQVDVFTKNDKFIAIARDAGVRITEDGLLEGTYKVKGWTDVRKLKNTGLIGDPPYFLSLKKEWVYMNKKGINVPVYPVSEKLFSVKGEILFNLKEEKDDFGGFGIITKDYKYLINYKYRKIQVYKLRINEINHN